MRYIILSTLLWVSFARADEKWTQWYAAGIESHLSNEWQSCIDAFEKSLSLYRSELLAISSCRFKCKLQNFTPLDNDDIEDYFFYEKAIKRSVCFNECKKTEFPDVVFDLFPNVKAIEMLQNSQTYKYLEQCYYQKNDYQKAASSALTYLMKYPEDNITRSNLDMYINKLGVKLDDIVNFEAEEYVTYYVNGMKTYDNQDWANTVEYMEKALIEYLRAEENCRTLCDGSFDQGYLPDLMTSISNHFIYSLKCKLRCKIKIQPPNGLYGVDLLADMFNFLQFAYYKLDRISDAGRAVASYLLFFPNDEDMLYNKKIYGELTDVSLPRPVALLYLKRNRYEHKLLNYIKEVFTKDMKLAESSTSNEIENEIENQVT